MPRLGMNPLTVPQNWLKTFAFASTALAIPIESAMPFIVVANGDSVAHTVTLRPVAPAGNAVSVTVPVPAGVSVPIPTLPFLDMTLDGGGTASTVYAYYSDVGLGPSGVGGTGLAGNSAALPPESATSTSGLMLGLGSSWKFTPKRTGTILVMVGGSITGNATAQSACTGNLTLYYGTGLAPSNGSAASGTDQGTSSQLSFTNVASTVTNMTYGMCVIALITGLTINTQYWFDFQVDIVAGWNTLGVTASSGAIAEYPT
jgi:hypothetical protein